MVIRAVFRASAVLLFILPCWSQTQPSKAQQIQKHLQQAYADLKANRPDEAVREFNAVLGLDSRHVEARTNLGVVLYFKGDYAQAAPQLRAALKLSPSLWNIQALLGMCEKRLGNADAARAGLEKAFAQLQDEKLRVQTGMELIEVYYAAGDLTSAAQVVGMLRQIRPTDLDVLYTAHRIYSDLRAETTLVITMTAPKSARMHQVMGQELAVQGKTEEAIAHYREALKIDSKVPGLHFELAELLNGGSGETQAEAEAEYKASLAENPFDAKAESRLGEIAFRAADHKTALARYSRAVSLRPNDAAANLGVGKTLAALHEPAKALPYLELAAKLRPYDEVAHYRLAAVYRELGRTADAERELGEFQKAKDMKAELKQIYDEMRIRPKQEERADPDVPK
jgi:tetratricopeptide (TPR) repeat protein